MQKRQAVILTVGDAQAPKHLPVEAEHAPARGVVEGHSRGRLETPQLEQGCGEVQVEAAAFRRLGGDLSTAESSLLSCLSRGRRPCKHNHMWSTH